MYIKKIFEHLTSNIKLSYLHIVNKVFDTTTQIAQYLKNIGLNM